MADVIQSAENDISGVVYVLTSNVFDLLAVYKHRGAAAREACSVFTRLGFTPIKQWTDVRRELFENRACDIRAMQRDCGMRVTVRAINVDRTKDEAQKQYLRTSTRRRSS